MRRCFANASSVWWGVQGQTDEVIVAQAHQFPEPTRQTFWRDAGSVAASVAASVTVAVVVAAMIGSVIFGIASTAKARGRSGGEEGGGRSSPAARSDLSFLFLR